MGKRDPRVDAYIAKAADFAKPILVHLREVVHAGCPDVEETMRWSSPSFSYKGFLCGMAAFKQHCVFGFWKGSLFLDKEPKGDGQAMGNYGRITKLGDLPSKKVLAGYVKKAAKLNEDGVKAPARAKPKEKRALIIPEALTAALKRNAKAQAIFEAFSPSHKREYAEWIADAKTEETRSRRLATAIEWIAEGKPRNWKYMNC